MIVVTIQTSFNNDKLQNRPLKKKKRIHQKHVRLNIFYVYINLLYTGSSTKNPDKFKFEFKQIVYFI